tara:strand:- start:4854 stop:5699 length:846 start_codon:yes stop_codon:yes gene_type:complete
MNKIIFAGNLTLDLIMNFEKKIKLSNSNQSYKINMNIGGIANNFQYLRKKYGKIAALDAAVGNDFQGKYIKDKFKLDNSEIYLDKNRETSTANIVVDEKSSEKTSFVNWGACKYKEFNKNYKNCWIHFSYVELLKKLKPSYLINLKKNNCFISADLCSNFYSGQLKKRLIKIFKLIDFLIISDNEAISFSKTSNLKIAAKKMGQYVKRLIMHYPTGSFYIEGKKLINYKIAKNLVVNKSQKLNGAGDIFASEFIYRIFKKKSKIDIAVQKAHKSASNFVKN